MILRFIYLFIYFFYKICAFSHKKTEDIDSSVPISLFYFHIKLRIAFVNQIYFFHFYTREYSENLKFSIIFITPGRVLYSSALLEESITTIFLHPAI